MSAPGAIDRVLGFWLGEVGPAGWYEQDDAVDRRCAQEFGALAETARAGGCAAWMASPRGALALLILLDQFPRNIHRGRAEAYAADTRARAVAARTVGLGHDRRVAEPERQFFYLPLMHSEHLADQERCLRLVLLRLPRTGATNLEHAVKHRDVIRRFGRFPSRNAALGRPDTAAERAYRAEGGYMS